jgi:hypothetical protein
VISNFVKSHITDNGCAVWCCDTVYADINNDSARFDPVASNKARMAGGDNQNIGPSGFCCDVACL